MRENVLFTDMEIYGQTSASTCISFFNPPSSLLITVLFLIFFYFGEIYFKRNNNLKCKRGPMFCRQRLNVFALIKQIY